MEKDDLLVIQKSKKLMEYTFTITNSENRFPKKIRYTLVQRLQNMVLDIVQGLIEANDIGNLTEEARNERRKKQRQVITTCKMMYVLVELSYNRNYINAHTMAVWSKHIQDVKAMTASWIKSDKKK